MTRFADVSYRGLRFAQPVGLVDTSVLTFVDRPQAPTVSLAFSQQALSGGTPALLRYVREQLSIVLGSVAGYAVTQQRDAHVADAAAVVVDAVAPERVVFQLYALDAARGRVVVVTVSAQKHDAARARAAFDDVVGSLRFDPQESP